MSGVLLAHGIGTREDLPLPFTWAVIGAIAALVVSFVALGLLWREPRLRGAAGGWPVPDGVARVLDARGFRRAVALLGVLAAAYVLLGLLYGPDDARNPTPHVVYVLVWVGLVPVSVLLGPVWRAVSPVRALHAGMNRVLGLDPREGLRPLPAGLGWWPAAVGLVAFAWLELVYPDPADLNVLRVAIALYAAVHLLAAFVYGSGWFARGDAFEAWSTLFGRFGVLGHRADGRLVLRSPLDGVSGVRGAPGLVAVCVVMLGVTVFDGVSGSRPYGQLLQGHGSGRRMLLGTAGVVATMLVLGGLYAGCTVLAGRIAGLGGRGMPTAFAHSLLPVALGYVVAHYYSLLVFEGQRAFIKLSDPLGSGANWLGLSGRAPDSRLIDPTLVACVQVGAIVVGHVLGVLLSHDRAVLLFTRRPALSQLPLLVLMVGLTTLGLFLLFEG